MTLQEKYDLYKTLIKSHQDANGFIYSDACDSLGFSSLVGCIPGINVDVFRACDLHTNQWFRRPLNLPPCYDCKNLTIWDKLKKITTTVKFKHFKSGEYKALVTDIMTKGGSSISRDMLLMLAWYTWANKRLDISELVINYAFKHCLKMGDGDPSRVFLTPALLATYAEISYRLGGPNRWWFRFLPQYETANVAGFEAHLSVLHILLREELTGKIPYKHVLELQYHRQPNNPLFAYAAGFNYAAATLLMNPKWWPETRLPNNYDRFDNWLTQRDFGTDWSPTPDQTAALEVFSGGDFLFVAWLLLGKT